MLLFHFTTSVSTPPFKSPKQDLEDKMPIRSLFISRGSNNYLLYMISWTFPRERNNLSQPECNLFLAVSTIRGGKSPSDIRRLFFSFLNTQINFSKHSSLYTSHDSTSWTIVLHSTRNPERRDDEIVALVNPAHVIPSEIYRHTVEVSTSHTKAVIDDLDQLS